MTKKSLCLSAVLGALLMTSAKAKVTVNFQPPGPYAAYLYRTDQLLKMQDAKDVGSIEFPDEQKPGSGQLTVIVANTNSGNEGKLAVPSTGIVTVTPAVVNAISQVGVSITDAKGIKPSSGLLILKDGKGKTQTRKLLASDSGRAVFEHVFPGAGSVTFQQGKPDNRQMVSVRLPLKRDAPILDVPVAITLPDGFTAAQQGAPKESNPVPAPISHGWLTGFAGFAIALIVVLGTAIGAVRLLRAKGITAESALSYLGVQLPDEPEPIPIVAAEPPPPPDPTICPYCGARKEPSTPCANCAVPTGTSPAAVSAAPAQPRLVALAGPQIGTVILLNGSISIGRDPGQDISIPEDASLSRRHATAEVAGSIATIVDEGSSNGTWVNGRRVERTELHPGDEITLGASRFRYEA